MTETLIVTVDHGTEYSHSTPIAVWNPAAGDLLSKNAEGEWGVGDNPMLLIDEFTSDEFKEKYGFDPPPSGTKRTLIAAYSWKEE